MPTISSFKPDPERFRGRPKHHLLDVSTSNHSSWSHFGFSGDQHLHAKVDDDDFWFESVMTIGERLCYVPTGEEPKFKSIEIDFQADGIRWQSGTLDTNVRVLYWARPGEPGFLIKI